MRWTHLGRRNATEHASITPHPHIYPRQWSRLFRYRSQKPWSHHENRKLSRGTRAILPEERPGMNRVKARNLAALFYYATEKPGTEAAAARDVGNRIYYSFVDDFFREERPRDATWNIDEDAGEHEIGAHPVSLCYFPIRSPSNLDRTSILQSISPDDVSQIECRWNARMRIFEIY